MKTSYRVVIERLEIGQKEGCLSIGSKIDFESICPPTVGERIFVKSSGRVYVGLVTRHIMTADRFYQESGLL